MLEAIEYEQEESILMSQNFHDDYRNLLPANLHGSLSKEDEHEIIEPNFNVEAGDLGEMAEGHVIYKTEDEDGFVTQDSSTEE